MRPKRRLVVCPVVLVRRMACWRSRRLCLVSFSSPSCPLLFPFYFFLGMMVRRGGNRRCARRGGWSFVLYSGGVSPSIITVPPSICTLGQACYVRATYLTCGMSLAATVVGMEEEGMMVRRGGNRRCARRGGWSFVLYSGGVSPSIIVRRMACWRSRRLCLVSFSSPSCPLLFPFYFFFCDD
jgi:hypothetical protein